MSEDIPTVGRVGPKAGLEFVLHWDSVSTWLIQTPILHSGRPFKNSFAIVLR